MEQGATYQKTLESQLRTWDAEINSLEAKSDIKLAKVEEHYYRVIRMLRAKECLLQEALHRLDDRNGDCPDEVRCGIEKAIEDMRRALGMAAAEFM